MLAIPFLWFLHVDTIESGAVTYRAPQVVKEGRDGYDGMAWGVLLSVMLLWASPFEHSTTAADKQSLFKYLFKEVRLQSCLFFSYE
jgi:membrane protein CcdC involved in cytochrome C biogenesis